MAAICLHFHEAKDESFGQYLNAFIEISCVPVAGEVVTVNGFKHIVTEVNHDLKTDCAQVYLRDFEQAQQHEVFNLVGQELAVARIH
jgi:hypothetical protein